MTEEKGKTVRAKSAEDYLKDGDKHRQQRKWREAVKAYTEAIELDKDDFRSYERRGRCYFELGDYHEAIINLTRAIEIKPNRYLLYDLRGRAYSMLGDKDAVSTDFTRAIELHPGHNVYLHKALAFSQMEEYDQAISDLNKAIDIKKDYAYAYLNRGVIYQKLGEKEKAMADYQHTIDLETNRGWSEQAREQLQALMDNE
jgi:tetratricopeptide (TPR) repeat protein